MTPNTLKENEIKRWVNRAGYELLLLSLAVLQLINSIIYIFFDFPVSASVIQIITVFLTLFFLFDAFSRFLTTPSKKGWLIDFYGYMIFLGSLPIPFFSIFRLLQLPLAVRRLPREELDKARRFLAEQRAQSALYVVFFAALVVLELASILVFRYENPVQGANIVSAQDAIWWTFVTMATVGYGDYFPVTTMGRIVGVFVMVVGVGIFSVATSYLSQSFLQSRRAGRLSRQLRGQQSAETTPYEKIREIKSLMEQQEKNNQEVLEQLRARLEALESQLKQNNGDSH